MEKNGFEMESSGQQRKKKVEKYMKENSYKRYCQGRKNLEQVKKLARNRIQ